MRTFNENQLARLFETFMNHTPALWWLKDAAGKFVFANKTFYETFQASPESLLGKQQESTLLPRSNMLTCNDHAVFEEGVTFQLQESITTPDGIERTFLIWKFPFEDNDEKYTGGIALDITEHRRVQRELEETRDKALESTALKRALFSSIQHELRTPLAGIIGINELLLLTNLDSQQRHLAQTVQKSSQALLSVLNDVLDLSKMESGALQVRQVAFDVCAVVKESVQLIMAAAMYKQLPLLLEIDPDVPEMLIGDPERLRQVLFNLFSNAVKFTPSGQVVASVKVLSQDKDSTRIRFCVKDSGIGIEKEKQQYLFVPFWQADMSERRRYGGVGLGLPLSKYLVEQMGSEGIFVESTPGQGSLFGFDVEFAKVLMPDGDSRLPPSPPILIVEDNPMLKSVTVAQLGSLGLQSDGASTYGEAISLYAAKPYRLVLCERAFDEASVIEFINSVRAVEKEQRREPAAIVILSAVPNEEERLRFANAGADGYAEKATSVAVLRELVEKFLPDLQEPHSNRNN